MKDIGNSKPNENDEKKKKNEKLVPIEADEIEIDCRGLDTKVLIDGREIFLEYFRVELDINGNFTGEKMGFRPRVLFGVRAKKVKIIQKEGVPLHPTITEAGIVEEDGVFKIEFRSNVPEEEDDEDEPTCSCDGHAGVVCGIHEPTGAAPPIGGYEKSEE